MKFLILLALCATVAYASSWDWNRGDDHGRNEDRHYQREDNHRRYENNHRQEDNHRSYDNGHNQREEWRVPDRHDRHDNNNNRHNVNEGGWAHGILSAGAGAGQGSGYDTGNRHW